MTQLTLAFLYNVRHVYPDADDLRTQVETDFDDAATIEAMTAHLEACGYRVIPIEADEQAYLELHRRRSEIDLALNYSMGLHGAARYAHLPAMLEMLQIPYTGSDPLTQALILNKERMQQVVAAAGGPVLPSWVPRSPDAMRPVDLRYPLIVKPVGQGSSAGITSASVVHDDGALREQIRRMLATFGEPPIVQRLLGGREFSVPLLGNPPVVLPPIEPDFSLLPPGFLPIDSLEVKWVFEEQSESHHLRCPAPVEPELLARIEGTVRLVWDALGIRDWCRIDLRADEEGNLFVLDVNSPPGMIPPEISTTSYFSLAGRAAGLSYDDLLRQVIEAARERTVRRG